METWRTRLRWLFGVLFVGAGINHFLNPEFYVSIMPPYLPWHLELVYLSGIAEIVIGVAVCVPKARPYSGWAAIALLVAVFPANVHMVMNPESYPDVPEIGLWVRLPFQALFIVWAWWVTRVPPTPEH